MGFYRGPQIIREGLILYLDSLNPRSYPSTGTTWFDLSGNGHNFTLFNSPTFDNGVLKFNGIDQYARILSSGLNLSPTTNRTIEIWFKLNSLPIINSGIFADQTSTSGALMLNTESKIVWRWDDSSYTDSTNKIIDLNEWNNIVVLLRNSYYVTYYVNGLLDRTEFRTSDIASSSVVSWSIARQNRDFTGDFLYSNIDVSIARQYNRLLTSEEIQQNYNATKGRYGL
jgi:hypothetical protein